MSTQTTTTKTTAGGSYRDFINQPRIVTHSGEGSAQPIADLRKGSPTNPKPLTTMHYEGIRDLFSKGVKQGEIARRYTEAGFTTKEGAQLKQQNISFFLSSGGQTTSQPYPGYGTQLAQRKKEKALKKAARDVLKTAKLTDEKGYRVDTSNLTITKKGAEKIIAATNDSALTEITEVLATNISPRTKMKIVKEIATKWLMSAANK